MIRILLVNLWNNIKKSPIISLIIFLQILLTGFFLFVTVNTHVYQSLRNTDVQNAYGVNKLLDISNDFSSPAGQAEMTRMMGIGFVSPEETGYSDYEYFHDKINESEIVKTAVQYHIQVNLDYPIIKWGIKDDSEGYYSFYNTKHEGADVTFDGVEYPEYVINAYAVDKNYLDIFGISLDSGRLFSDEEFENCDFSRVPVILGYDYREYFSLGDTFEASFIDFPGNSPSGNYAKPMTFEVIGFVGKDSIVYMVGGGVPYSLNKYIIIPYYTKTLEEWLEFYSENKEYGGGTFRYVNYYMHELGIGAGLSKHYVTSKENESAAIEEINRLLDEAGLGAAFKVHRVIAPEQLADQYAERTALETILLAVMLALSLLSIVFSTVNNVTDNMKTYAIHNLVGAQRRHIVLFAVAETVLYCILGFAGGMLWYKLMYNNVRGDPTYETAVVYACLISLAYIAVACMISILVVLIMTKKYSISLLIRGNIVKSGGKVSLYKIITFAIIAVLSICSTVAANYAWQIEHVDKYQHDFFSNQAKTIYISSLGQENAPAIDFEYDIDVDNYIIDKLIKYYYDSLLGPSIRATFYKGNVELPEMTSGRYFTEEEIKAESDKVVVGKNVVKDFVDEKDGEMIFTYLDKEYKVIGIMGREGHDTSLDNWVFFTLPTILKNSDWQGTYIIDAPTTGEIAAVIDDLQAQLAEISLTRVEPIPLKDVGISDDVLIEFILLVLFTALIFAAYYINENFRVFDVKKLIGYSKSMIFADTLFEFLVISTASYIAGTAILFICAKTVMGKYLLFSSLSLNFPVLGMSYCGVLILAVILSVIALHKTFRGTARDLKRG